MDSSPKSLKSDCFQFYYIFERRRIQKSPVMLTTRERSDVAVLVATTLDNSTKKGVEFDVLIRPDNW